MTIHRAPLPAHFEPAPCDAPPADLGTLRRARHPVLATVFLASIGAAMTWGAWQSQNPVPALVVALLGATACVAGAAMIQDGTSLVQSLTKLGWVAPSRSGWAIGLLAGISGAAGALVHAGPRSELGTMGLQAGAAALWLEVFGRGFVQRTWGRRYRAVVAIAVAALLEGVLTAPIAAAVDGFDAGLLTWIAAAFLFACAAGFVFELQPSLVPGLVTHGVVLWAAFVVGQPTPLVVAAIVLWSFGAAKSRRTPQENLTD